MFKKTLMVSYANVCHIDPGCQNGNDEPPYFHPVQLQCPRFWTLAMSTRRSCHLLLVGLPATISASRSRVAWAIACHGNSQWVHLDHLDPSSHLSAVNCCNSPSETPEFPTILVAFLRFFHTFELYSEPWAFHLAPFAARRTVDNMPRFPGMALKKRGGPMLAWCAIWNLDANILLMFEPWSVFMSVQSSSCSMQPPIKYLKTSQTTYLPRLYQGIQQNPGRKKHQIMKNSSPKSQTS